jgi:ATP-dependent Clp protease ATP-binding subunit ClpA
MSFFIDRDELFLPNGNPRTDVVTEPTLRMLDRAVVQTRKTGWQSVRTPHLFMGLLATSDPTVIDWGNRLGVNLSRLLEQFREIFQTESAEDEPPVVRMNREFLSDNVIRLLKDSLERARTQGRLRIAPMDILVELFSSPSNIVAECFRRIGLSAEQLTELAILAEQDSDAEM